MHNMKLFWYSVFVTCFSASAMASGWNDFMRDIGHGFTIAKMSSLEVCLEHNESGLLIVCADSRSGDFGPITAFAFTDKNLLLKTLGAKPSEDIPGMYFTDSSKEFFFIVDQRIEWPSYYKPIGPLSASEFYQQPEVPQSIEWQATHRADGGLAILLTPVVFLILAYFIARRLGLWS